MLDSQNVRKSLNNCRIEKAQLNDLPRLMEIYQGAREYMKKTNNPDQWGDNWPSEEKIKEDIEVGRSFVVKDDENIYAVFAFVVGVDITYVHMIEGQWLSDKEYGTVHRLASSFQLKGLFPYIQNYLEKHYAVNFRIDTHCNNKTMINQILKTGYVYTGLISPIEGGIRNAYEKVIYK